MPAQHICGVTNRWSRCCVGRRRVNAARRPGLAKGAWSADLSAQDRGLVAQEEDLGVVGCLRSGQQSEPAEELAEDQVEESEHPAGDDRGPPPPEANGAGQRHGPGFRHRQAATPGRSGRRLRRGRGPWRLVGGVMWASSKGHVSSTTSWSAASCCSPSLGCSTTART
jgi:hypothetical protein